MVSGSLWKLAAKAPIPEWATLNKLTFWLERILTHDYELQRKALAHVSHTAHSILDVGCGGAVYYDRSSHYVIGLDINPKRLKFAKKYCNVTKQCDITQGIGNYPVNAVLCLEVIEHLTYDEGESLLNELSIYPLVVLSTPRHFFEVHRNGHEKHITFWGERLLAVHGYTKVEEVQVPPSNIYIRRLG